VPIVPPDRSATRPTDRGILNPSARSESRRSALAEGFPIALESRLRREDFSRKRRI